MDLVAVLSNIRAEALYQRLTERDWRQVPRVQAKRPDRSRDGKLKFGTVSGAVLHVLRLAETPMRYSEIHRAVEESLGMAVCRSSVKQFLSAESGHRKPRFVRVARGQYRHIW